jgi:oxygen-dependent protoporphyrinogen oxidase
MGKPVKIIGAGFSGLVTAWALQRRGVSVEVHERSTRPGGLISTRTTSHGSYETAANALLNSILVEDLFQDLNLELAQPSKIAKKKLVYRDGPRRWPLTAAETSGLMTKWIAARIRGAHAPVKYETLAAWADRVLGVPTRARLLGPAIQGIYAGDPERLSASLLLGHLFQKPKPPKPKLRGSVFPKNGMQELITALVQKLEERGVPLHFGSMPEVSGADGTVTVIATSAPDAANLLADAAPALSTTLRTVEMLPLVCVELFLPETDRPAHGYGCLFPADSDFTSLGVLFDHYLFPHRVKGSAERWIMGGSREPGIAAFDDKTLIERAINDRSRLGGKGLALEAFVTRWPSALPYYTVELERTLDQIQLPPNIELIGNYLGRIGLSQILTKADELANRIAGRNHEASVAR